MRVLVLGAGVLGAAVANRIAARGHEVRVLDAAPAPATGTSAATFAWVNGNNKQPPHYQELNAAAIREHHRLGGVAAGWLVPNGHLEVAATEEHRTRLTERVTRLAATGYPASFLAPAEVTALEPDLRVEPDALAAWFPDEAHCHPEAFVAMMLAGVPVSTNQRVVGVEEHRTGASVQLSDGTALTADHVVTCLGRHTAALHEDVPMIEPAPGNAAVGFLARTAPVAARLSRVVTTSTVNLRPAGGGALVAQTLDQDVLADPARPVPPSVVSTMAERVRDRLGYPVRVESAVVGQRALPADGLPVVGPLGAHRYVVVSHSAVTLAPLLGELAAREVCSGAEEDVLRPYRVDRFRRPHPTPTPARRPGEQ
ncbi:NAD(P)/FAD-dependent oxidoreductase [Actinophytocola gossypii]|uniref:FAD-dependent oxidoreductase n=1 Tax=Actinophytocola gossypii TaxID=2812003 RepID=A0ABT2J9V6_9PSEU|nr:FAD-dependent oxidoreductase [Actinophytocola gossypii]MCT2584486.1 FAD-dependent oxidoreductase [Actinophytocola gossypii]